jgi:hypothetical protein
MEWINMNYHYFCWITKLHKKSLQTKIQSWIQQMLHQTFIPAPHKNINSGERETSNALPHYICQKWRKSDVDSQKFLKTSSKSKITKLLSNK